MRYAIIRTSVAATFTDEKSAKVELSKLNSVCVRGAIIEKKTGQIVFSSFDKKTIAEYLGRKPDDALIVKYLASGNGYIGPLRDTVELAQADCDAATDCKVVSEKEYPDAFR